MQQLQVIGDDLLRERVLRVNQLDLHDQAFLKIARGHAGRVEFLHHGKSFLDIIHRIVSRLRDFIERRRKVAVLIEVADDRVRDLTDRFGADAHAQLPREVIGQARRRGEELVERRFLDFLVLAARGALRARVEVLPEERTEIEFIKWVGCGSFRNFFRFLFEERFVGVAVGGDAILGQLFQNRIRHDLLIDHLSKLETVQRQHADHLDEARRQNLLLRQPEMQFGCEPVHGVSSA